MCLGRRRRPRHHSGGGPRLLPTLERELGQSLAAQLRQDGVEVFTGVSVTGATPALPSPSPTGEAYRLEADAVLVATGRRPATGGLFAGDLLPELERGSSGWTDSSAPPSLPLRHRGRHRRGHAGPQGGGGGALCGRPPAGPHPLRGVAPIPACVYTSPELAQVGLTADEARARASPVPPQCVLGATPVPSSRGKAGLCQAGISPGEPRPAGAQLCCYRATDLISELALAVTLELTAEQLLRPVRPHPTFAEAISEAVEAAFPSPSPFFPQRGVRCTDASFFPHSLPQIRPFSPFSPLLRAFVDRSPLCG
ncbi:FAD-dependent oxidoreductase [Flavonifractor plautii]|nr:FAD-dependent oxidoreductase [Flavonifractor plautii]